MKAPVAVNADGSPITGPALEEFSIDNNTTMTEPLTYPAVSLDKSEAKLTIRFRYEDQPIAVPMAGWDYANERGTAIKLSGSQPFQEGALYEFLYQAKNPVVSGLGFAAIRDLASFVRSAQADDHGNANQLKGEATAIYTACVSQPCRTAHDFVWFGFNEDESGKRRSMVLSTDRRSERYLYELNRFAQPFTNSAPTTSKSRWFPLRVSAVIFPFHQSGQIGLSPAGKTDGRLTAVLG